MSDTSQGSGWWQASDGKWYSPELYPTEWPAANPSEQADLAEAAPIDVPVAEAAPVDVPVVEADPVEPEPVAPPKWEPPATVSVTAPVETPPEPTPPSGWAAPDPAAGEPTLVEGIPPIGSADPTLIRPAMSQPTPPPIAPVEAVPPGQSAPTSLVAPPSSWDAPGAPPVQPVAGVTKTLKAQGDPFGGLFGLVGGAALIVGSFLAWAKAGGTLTSGTVNGLTGSNGWGTLVAGLVAASGAGLLMAGVRKVWVGAAIVAASLTALVLAAYSYIDIGNTSDDLPDLLRSQEGVGADIANGALLDYDIGLWIVMAGAATALVAGFIALARRQ